MRLESATEKICPFTMNVPWAKAETSREYNCLAPKCMAWVAQGGRYDADGEVVPSGHCKLNLPRRNGVLTEEDLKATGREGVYPAVGVGDQYAPDTLRIHDDDGRYGASQVCRERGQEAEVCECSIADTENQGLEGRDAKRAGCTGGRYSELPGSIRGDNQADPWSEDWYSVALRTCIRDFSHGLPRGMDRVNRLKALGNSVVPQIVEILGRAIMEKGYELD